ncbi:MAG: ubiquinol-cytochrome c reductase cytochrome b subunit, partial [Nocardioidaceae bacterium]|nr:ubiquinol-cytochrome c reductase cytochrome b subunit [Nocardioidaceae bacterium]
NENVVGYPMMPIYAAKAGGFFFIVFGVTALMGGLMSINPVWRFGPYNPSQVTAGSQPDWYMGVAEGLLRIMPGWETHIWGKTISWNVIIPGQVMPMVIFAGILTYPFIEAWITGDKTEHHLLQRPRNAANRTAFLVGMMTLYGLLWAAGGNDIIAELFHLDLNYITYFMRVAVFVVPPFAFWLARRWCISLQRSDEARVLHGIESGIIMRSPEGGYSERHDPLSIDGAYTLMARDEEEVYHAPPVTDLNGVASRKVRMMQLRAKASQYWFGSNIRKPTREELEAAHAHSEHELEAHDEEGRQVVPAGDYMGRHELEGHAAEGHQFDGRASVEGDELRKH